MPIEAVVKAVAEAKEEAGYVEPSGGYAQVQPAGGHDEPAAGHDDGVGADEEEAARPTAADLDVIDKDPVLRATYRGLMRKFHAGNERVSHQGRQAEEAMATVRAVRADPEGSLRAMADAAGLRVVERGEAAGDDASGAPPPTLDRVRARLEKAVGKQAADVLAPVLAEVVGEITGDAVGSIREHVEAQQAATVGSQIAAGVNSFAAEVARDGGDWDKDIEREMAALVGTVMPGPRTTLPEYLGMLHSTVTANRSRGAPRASRPPRAARSAVAAHETVPERKTESGIRIGMDPRDAVRLAVAQAQAQAQAQVSRRR